MNKPALIALDLDGTLLRDDKTVSAYSIDILKQLSARGIPLFFVTGRDRRIAEQVLPFVDFPVWAIVNNGVAAYQLPGWTPCFVHYLPAHIRSRVIKCLGEIGRYPLFIVSRDGSILDRVMDKQLLADEVYRAYADRHAEHIAVVDSIADSALLQRGLAMFLCEPNEQVEFVRAHMTGILGEVIEHRSLDNLNFLPTHRVIEMVEPGWTKYDGIVRLQALLALPDHEIYAFGDDYNDLDMLRQAGRSFAPENAIDAAKTAAREIIPANNEDGVARTLEMMFLE